MTQPLSSKCSQFTEGKQIYTPLITTFDNFKNKYIKNKNSVFCNILIFKRRIVFVVEITNMGTFRAKGISESTT